MHNFRKLELTWSPKTCFIETVEPLLRLFLMLSMMPPELQKASNPGTRFLTFLPPAPTDPLLFEATSWSAYFNMYFVIPSVARDQAPVNYDSLLGLKTHSHLQTQLNPGTRFLTFYPPPHTPTPYIPVIGTKNAGFQGILH